MIERTLTQFEAYRSGQKIKAEQILASLCWDIGQDSARSQDDTAEEDDWLAHPEWYLESIEDLTPFLADKLSSLSWYPDHGEAHLLYRTDSSNPPPDRLPFDYAWLHISFAEDEMRAIPRGTFRDVRDLLIRERVGEGFIHSYEKMNDQFVLFVLVDGPGYTIPDIAAVGPAVRSKSDNGEAAPDMVKTVFCDLNRTVSDHGFDEATLRQKLGSLLRLGNPDRWRETFSTSADTRKAIRERFARQLRDRIEALMNAIVSTAGDTYPGALGDADEDTALKAAREAATLLVFRLMFLSEMESRHLLYQHTGPRNERILIEYAAEILQTSARTKGKSTGDIDMLKRLTHLTRAVRTQEDYTDAEVLLSGGSIFANRPNDQFTVYPAAWLNTVEEAVTQNTISAPLHHQWNDALARTTELVTGFIDDDVQLTKTRAGQGAAEHTHRIFGDVYEQLLRFTPERDDERIRLIIDDEERNKVAAHYTPADLVEEVVRPTLGHLFEQHWNACNADPAAYEERLMDLRIVDPAMGSAHFLTVAALELAREVAYVQMNGTPRPFDWHEPLEHDNPIGYDPGDEGYPGEADDVLPQPAYHGAGGADTFNQKVAHILPRLVQRNIYGVDVKPMAAELGKLALWLFTMSVQDHSDTANGAPSLADDLVYLDANIKSGDSLVGMRRSDVHDTIENTLRASSSVVNTQNTLFATEKQVDSVADKMKRAETLLAALREGAAVLSDDDRKALEEALGEPLNLDAQPGSYARKERLDRAVRAYLSDLRWLFDLTLAIHYIGYTSGSRAGKAGQLYEALFNENPAGKDTNKLKEPIEEALGTLFDAPESDGARTYQTNLQDWITQQPDLVPFHWELEYPDAFAHDGFDAVVANPPFIGDRDLRERLGSEDLVEFLANYFIPQQKKSDYSGFFFWRYHHITNQDGAVGSLASNSIAQASNRAYVTKPLTHGADAPFTLFRAMPNAEWPSEANVHFAAGFMARQSNGPAVILRDGIPASVTHEQGISSYFDEYPDYDLKELISEGEDARTFTGMFLRGNFSVHRQPGDSLADAVEAVPESERDALAAYLNADNVQNNPAPTPSDVVIDFFEPLRSADLGDASAAEQRAFLEDRYPVLFDQLQHRSPHDPEQECIYEQREALESSSSNDDHKGKWWLFGSVRHGLRNAWESSSVLYGVPGVFKTWNLFVSRKEVDIGGRGIRLCPIHALFIAPSFKKEHFAITSSFLFEMITRRQCSSLKSDLRFTPTNVFPYFPWPWEPEVEDGTLTIGTPPAGMKASLETAAQNLLDLRTDILERPEAHGLTRAQVGGPTDLYNLYDSNPHGDTARDGAENGSIEKLRQAHVDLLDAVLRAYGWDDLAAKCTRADWTFDRPWLDRTERFVPPEPVRAKLFERIDQLNSERYEQECDMMTDLIITELPPGGLNKTGFGEEKPFSEMSIDADMFEELMLKEQARPNPRVNKEGYNWKRL